MYLTSQVLIMLNVLGILTLSLFSQFLSSISLYLLLFTLSMLSWYLFFKFPSLNYRHESSNHHPRLLKYLLFHHSILCLVANRMSNSQHTLYQSTLYHRSIIIMFSIYYYKHDLSIISEMYNHIYLLPCIFSYR